LAVVLVAPLQTSVSVLSVA